MSSGRYLLVSATLLLPLCGQALPRVSKLEPAHLANDVDPDRTTQLVLTFDQAMDPKHHALCGGGPSFPVARRMEWRDERTFVAEVQLERGRIYAIDIACAGSSGFRSKAGMSLRAEPWRFATAGDALADGASATATERLFNAIRDHYSYRDRLGIDWGEVEQTHLEALHAARSGPALALLVAEVLATAQDPHVSVRWQDGVIPAWQRQVASNFDARGLQKALPKLERIGRIGSRAITTGNIGYLAVNSFAREQRDDFDQLIEALRGLLECEALVLDLRQNSGGDETHARRLAAFFVRGDQIYAGHRVRDARAEGGFRAPEMRVLRGNAAPDVFPGQVAVLMGPLNMSSCEAFLLMMKQAEKATLVGMDSYGSSGNPQPHSLLPGLTVLLPSWQALRPDGSMFEGEGIAPHIHVPTKPADLVNDDPVLQEALLRLRGQR
jgi:carboxyl-terminal processing protease